MLARDYQTHLRPRTLFLIAGAIGLVIGLLALQFIAIPAWKLLDQLALYPPIERISIFIKLLSPLICFGLAFGWVAFLLWMGDHLLILHLRQPGSTLLQQTPLLARPQLPSQLEGTTMAGPTFSEAPLAAPPLFQRDPTQPDQVAQLHAFLLSVTPLPAINPDWKAPLQEEDSSQDTQERTRECDDAQERIREREDDQAPVTEHVPDALEGEEANPQPMPPAQQPAEVCLPAASHAMQAESPIAIFLLKRVRVQLRAPDGTTREVKLRRGENGIRLIMLAYIAWRKGEPVDRDKLLTYVLGRGRRRDMDTDQLSEVFDAAKKYLREDLKKAINELNNEAGQELIAEKSVNLFSTEPGFYWLHPSCRVVDLETIEQHYHMIRLARKEGLLDEKLDGSVPGWVIEACQQLIAAYPGDFLQTLIEKFPDEFGAWVREPFTLYRDRYLDALWILATYESALGRNFVDERLTTEQNEEQRRQHIARAAQFFDDYARYALNSKWDQKLKFAYRANKDGERVIMAPRALRRCVVELGKLGKTDAIDQVYLAFKERMSSLSEGHWTPDQETESDVAEAKRQTSAYRFSAQLPTKASLPNEQHS